MTPGQVLITALVSIAGTVAIGLYLNQQVSGSFLVILLFYGLVLLEHF